MWSRPPMKRWGQAEIVRSWGPWNPPAGNGDFPARSPSLCARCERTATQGRLGASQGWLNIQSQQRARVSSPARHTLSSANPPRRVPELAGGRRGSVPVCVEHIPLLRSRCRVYLTQLPPGDSPPPAQKSPRAPCPLCQGEKAAEPETKKLLPPSTLRPSTRPRHSPAPSLDPGDTASAHARGRDQGTGNRVGESAFSTPRGYSCPCTPPGDTPRQPRPHHSLPKASRAPDTANPSPNRQHHPSSGATGGRGAHKADGESGA